MKIATTTEDMYLFTESPSDAIRYYKDTGFKYLDYSFYNLLSDPKNSLLSDSWEYTVNDIQKAAYETDIKFIQAHAPAGKIIGCGSDECLAATLRSIEICGKLGIKNMVIHSAFSNDFKYPDDKLAYYEANAPFFRALIPTMEKNEVSILFENTTAKHCQNSFFPIMAADLNDFIDYMKHPLFAACWDVGHAHMDGIDQYTEIVKLGKNLKAIHVHDNFADVDRHLAPFIGTMDYDALIRGLIDSKYEGYFTLESTNFFKFNRSSELNDQKNKLAHPTEKIKKAATSLLYLISKTMLEAYGIYEE